jgi:hypothetical protein
MGRVPRVPVMLNSRPQVDKGLRKTHRNLLVDLWDSAWDFKPQGMVEVEVWARG